MQRPKVTCEGFTRPGIDVGAPCVSLVQDGKRNALGLLLPGDANSSGIMDSKSLDRNDTLFRRDIAIELSFGFHLLHQLFHVWAIYCRIVVAVGEEG